ncbi:hypothetical protein L9H26_04075 [Morganella psychrotolerans]|uniref:Nucleotide modification associated domain-containing protein n=1 Tax=Morganella psychrotolerans TaxID=368603 RepID=A0A5M9RBN2_9GAMM|nr:Nmad5 family putative nucleotide modification protein [Morganella psychrotolerans]KAA8717446.1 hypothetical protein F4V73_06275 [Morganella psychrotolerans]OBU08281.1 hypothetical protein AYY16_02750 [Morganella psychrotolerans]
MTRLTNNIKSEIIRSALKKAGIYEEKEKLRVEKNTLANDARIASFGGNDAAARAEEKLASILALVKDLQNTVDGYIYLTNAKDYYIYPAFGGQRNRLAYGDDSQGKSISLLTPSDDKCLFPADHELSKRFTQINEKEASIEKREAEIKANVKSALDSVTTIKKLISVWPEVKEILPDGEQIERVTLPAVKVENLNSLIGLPTESEAA